MPSVTTDNFAVILAQKRLKVSEVARQTGISRTTITNLYYGKSSAISFEVLKKLCQFLECNIGDLVKYDKGEQA